MNYKTIKLASEAPIPLELIKRDNGVYAVVIGDLRIESDYGVRVLVAQPYEEVSRHKVTATIEGFGAKMLYFESRYDGADEVQKLEDAGAKIEREDVKVKIDSDGKIVSAEPGKVVDPTADDCPF